MSIDSASVTKSIQAINECVRHLTWVKSDLRATSPPVRSTPAYTPPVPSSLFNFSTPGKTQGAPFSFSAPSTSLPTSTSDQSLPHKQPQQQQQPPPPQATPNTYQEAANVKRRVDILATPQFAEVMRYVCAFPNPDEVLALLWHVADGQSAEEDLDMLKTYIRIVKLDHGLNAGASESKQSEGQ